MTTSELVDRLGSKYSLKSNNSMGKRRTAVASNQQMGEISQENQVNRLSDFKKVFQLKDYYDYPDCFEWSDLEWAGAF